MAVSCAECGGSLEGKRSVAKFCGARCRNRASRKPKTPAVDTSGLYATSRRELERVGRADTVLGQLTLELARRIGSASGETGSAFATLIKEFRATMTAALSGASGAGDELDEVRRKREQKAREAAGRA